MGHGVFKSRMLFLTLTLEATPGVVICLHLPRRGRLLLFDKGRGGYFTCMLVLSTARDLLYLYILIRTDEANLGSGLAQGP